MDIQEFPPVQTADMKVSDLDPTQDDVPRPRQEGWDAGPVLHYTVGREYMVDMPGDKPDGLGDDLVSTPSIHERIEVALDMLEENKQLQAKLNARINGAVEPWREDNAKAWAEVHRLRAECKRLEKSRDHYYAIADPYAKEIGKLLRELRAVEARIEAALPELDFAEKHLRPFKRYAKAWWAVSRAVKALSNELHTCEAGDDDSDGSFAPLVCGYCHEAWPCKAMREE